VVWGGGGGGGEEIVLETKGSLYLCIGKGKTTTPRQKPLANFADNCAAGPKGGTHKLSLSALIQQRGVQTNTSGKGRQWAKRMDSLSANVEDFSLNLEGKKARCGYR